MKHVLVVLSILTFALVGCDTGLLGSEDGGAVAEDEINDVLRSTDFDYAVLVPVRLSVSVNPFGLAAASRGIASAPVVVRVTDLHGEPLFQVASRDGEAVSGEMLVPVGAEAVTLTVDSPDFETRELMIEDPAIYAEINRVLAVELASGQKLGDDSDGDGIDDAYDAFPSDPRLAFKRSIPAADYLRIAFEDNFPDLGDGDYNDFVAEYRITEYRSGWNTLVKLEGTARAVTRGAGFDHEFGILVDFAGQSGTQVVDYYDGMDALIGTVTEEVTDATLITLFESTKSSFTRQTATVTMDNIDPDGPVSLGYTTTFAITFNEGKATPVAGVWAPYDPYLIVDNPDLDYRPDVHLIGKRPLPNSQNPDGFKDFRDADGYPRALLVPDDWMSPVEKTHIETAYPQFVLWRESLGMSNSDWYLSPDPDHVVPASW